MALVINDRVKETSTTTGTGTLSLAGAVTGFETFSSAIGNGNTTYYAIVNSNGEFEVGLGTVSAAALARTTIISSSNSDSAVNFSAGTKNVFVTLPASKAVIEDASSNITIPADLSVGDDLTVLGGVIDFKSNSGSPAALRMYCEVSNAHYQTLLPQPHSAAAGNSLRLPDSGDTGTQDLVAVDISQTLTNKTLTSAVLNSTISGTSIKDEDNMSSNSASHLATQQSIKSYVDTQVATVPVGDITSVVAGTNLTGGGTSGDVTVNLADASTSAKGAASFSSDNFAASSGAITIKDLGVATAEIQNDAVTQAKIADDAVGADQLAADAVVTASIVDANVTTAKVADNAITLAKMASGTDGNIISYDASGNPVAIATGSSGQVLTSAGAGAQPSFQTPTVGDITSVVAGSGLTGGATSGAATLNVGAGTGVTVNADDIAIGQSVATSASPTFAGLTTTADINFGDNDKAIFGDGSDFEIYHSGSASIVREASAGNLLLAGNDVQITNGAMNETHIDCNNNGSVDLYHDNSKKLETTSAGVQTTGTVNVNGAYTLPTSDGSANQVLTTDGSGALTFETPTTGDITGVTAGTLLDGGGTSGSVTLNVDLSELATSTSDGDGDFFCVVDASNNQKKLTKGNINNSGFNNDAGYTTNTGDITSVVAGDGLTGGATSGAATLNIGAGTGIDVAADAISVDVSDFMTNGSNNRIVTATGTDAQNAEANATFDGSTLAITGAITATGDVTAFSSSDKSLKENISNIENAVDKVSKINGVYYNWTFEAQEKNAHFGKEKEVGVIAQEVEKVLPEIVSTRDDGTKAVKYDRLCALLIESVKELKKEIEELKSGA